MLDLTRRLHEYGSVLLETIEPPHEERVALLFSRPAEVRVAWDAAELDGLLEEVDRATASGGFAAGFLSYEAGSAWTPRLRSRRSVGPLAWFGFYGRPLRLPLVAVRLLGEGEPWHVGPSEFSWSPQRYNDAFVRVREHIYEGDVYQVNLTGMLRFRFGGSPVGLYGALARTQSNVWGAYVNMGQRQILSRSPEVFFQQHGDRILTRPMKGTRPVGPTREASLRSAHALATDPKNRAENLMIVDLLRNDLSVVCVPDSVRVPELFSTEVHETLVQMTSTITGHLRPSTSLRDLMVALFPCGSVTGAPKIRAMQLIRDIEPLPRGVYCGAVGYVGPSRTAVFNVAIRTIELEGDTGTLGTGSGVVWDSDSDEEYVEILLKTRFFREVADCAAHASGPA